MLHKDIVLHDISDPYQSPLVCITPRCTDTKLYIVCNTQHGIKIRTNTQPISAYCTLSHCVHCTIEWNTQIRLRMCAYFRSLIRRMACRLRETRLKLGYTRVLLCITPMMLNDAGKEHACEKHTNTLLMFAGGIAHYHNMWCVMHL